MKMPRFKFVSGLCALLSTLPAVGQVPDQLKYSIPAPPVGAQSGAALGYSVAISEGLIVVGAPYDDTGGYDSGVVKVFDSETGTLLRVLPNPDPASQDYFGWAVAISGTRVVVAAYGDDTAGFGSGSVYVYDLGSTGATTPLVVLHKSNVSSEAGFGNSVAISGTRVVVGVPYDDAGESNTGSAYVYDLAGADPALPVAIFNNPNPEPDDLFGYSVGISGTRIVVGAYLDFGGAPQSGSAPMSTI
jgi:FG-GAP repeat